jgi:4-amino-4-deoxy-L-arabinose transferase-like glycosyltransferase
MGRRLALRGTRAGFLILLLAALLRFHALGQDARFHPDEALFSTFARSAALDGGWLLPGALDKPPLSIYTSAAFMALLARADITPGLPDLTPRLGEFAARFPNLLASLVLVALAYALGRRLYGRQRDK